MLGTDPGPWLQGGWSGTRREISCTETKGQVGEVGCSQVPRGPVKGHGIEVAFYSEPWEAIREFKPGSGEP